MSTPGFGPPPGDVPPPPAYAPQAPPARTPQAYGAEPAPQPPFSAPEFVAFDKNNAVVIDAEGVSFDIGGQVADFPWQQLAQLHYTAQGVFLRVGITHSAGWFHECVVNAKKQQKMIRWLTELGPVAAYYQAQLAQRGAP
ncbi:hypothetical protein [Streptomyces sp. KLOTTS4A1]|uniref:hypothetical protein n=1 Tax=Streptomyces sp. KLOTTS4A1 TaxID=3390996 RepID=UPI0039F57121